MNNISDKCVLLDTPDSVISIVLSEYSKAAETAEKLMRESGYDEVDTKVLLLESYHPKIVEFLMQEIKDNDYI